MEIKSSSDFHQISDIDRKYQNSHVHPWQTVTLKASHHLKAMTIKTISNQNCVRQSHHGAIQVRRSQLRVARKVSETRVRIRAQENKRNQMNYELKRTWKPHVC